MRRVRGALLGVVVAATVVAGYPGALAVSLWAGATTTPMFDNRRYCVIM